MEILPTGGGCRTEFGGGDEKIVEYCKILFSEILVYRLLCIFSLITLFPFEDRNLE